jgi:hypothetical protein
MRSWKNLPNKRYQPHLFVAGLTLALALHIDSARSQQALVGEWLNGSTNFADVSGYTPAGRHDGFIVGGGHYVFTNDVPPSKTGQSMFFFNGDTGLAISNSSTVDAAYTNTFDNKISNSFTISFWAKGWPGNWNPFVSKYGESAPSPSGGWQVRVDGANNVSPCWTIRGAGGAVTLGTAVNGNPDDLAATSLTFGNDGYWHMYVDTFDASARVRNLYVDGVLAASETNITAYSLAPTEHLCIGARDADGSTFGNFFTGQIYDVRVYNYALPGGSGCAIPAVILSSQTNVHSGQTVQLSVGNLTGSFGWTSNGIPVLGANTNSLTITNVTVSAVYRCYATNQCGDSYPIEDFTVNVLPPPMLVGRWLPGLPTLADVSSYQLAGTHDGYLVGSNHYFFTNDVPPGHTGQSIYLFNNDTAIAISNSSTLDAHYTNTFDGGINNAMTVEFWAKGYPGNWSPWVSKYGENGQGWQLRDGGNNMNPAWTIRGAGGTITQGTAVFGNPEELRGTIASNDSLWHKYIGTFDATTGERKLYIDGVLSGAETNNHLYSLAANSHVCIGARDAQGTNSAFFTGAIYDVRIYNYALPELPVGGPLPPPIALPPVGEWFKGSNSLADVSGYQPAGTHDGFDAAGTGAYGFTNDVPPGKTGVSLDLPAGTTAIAISNSSTWDAGYTNTFDETISNTFTVAFWAKGWPGIWNPFVSKNGRSGSPGSGWGVRSSPGDHPCFSVQGAGGSAVPLGTIVYGLPDELAGTNVIGNDGLWHHYAGVFSAATGVRSLYVDGVLSAQETGVSGYNLAKPEHLVLGGADVPPGNVFQDFFIGRLYDMRVYDYDLTSNQVAALAALPDPLIIVQPKSTTAYIGGKTTLSATIKGTAPITNHWQFNGTNLVDGSYNGTLVLGSTSNVLTLYNVSASFQGTYDLVVSNSLGMAISGNAIITVLATVPFPVTNLVGAWLMGAANLADSSGYRPAGTHDGYGVTGAGIPSSAYAFTNDLPPGVNSGQSLLLNGTVAIAISNSSTLDANYTNTFDDVINTNGMSVTFWAKGLPGTWHPWVSKFGENSQGWQLRVNASGNTPCWTIRGTGGNEDLSSTIGSVDTNWHFYAGTYSPVTGNRTLYVDGVLAAQQTGQGPLIAATASHLTIGGMDQGGNAFATYFTGELYGVRVYNTELGQFMPPLPPLPPLPPPGPHPMPTGTNRFVLTWPYGTLQQATNPTGPWISTGATSPFTNSFTNGPQMFYRLSYP